MNEIFWRGLPIGSVGTGPSTPRSACRTRLELASLEVRRVGFGRLAPSPQHSDGDVGEEGEVGGGEHAEQHILPVLLVGCATAEASTTVLGWLGSATPFSVAPVATKDASPPITSW